MSGRVEVWVDRSRSAAAIGHGLVLGLIVLAWLGASIARAATLYVGDYGTNTIERMKTDGTERTTVLSGLGGVRGIAIDPAHEKLYWQEAASQTIRRAALDGSNPETVLSTSPGIPYGLALDLDHGKMYWTEYSIALRIRRANLDGSAIETLIDSGLAVPTGIALDVAGGKMYWADFGAGTVNRANLDGSSREQLVAGVAQVNHVALDVAGDALYFTQDGGAAGVKRCRLDGSNLLDVVVQGGAAAGLALDVDADAMYWTIEDGGAIESATLAGANVTSVFGYSRPLSLALVGEPTVPPQRQKILPSWSATDPASGAELGMWSTDLEGDTMVAGAWHDDSPSGPGSGAAYVYRRVAGGTWVLARKLSAPDAGPGSGFGIGVALSGDTLLVGAVYANAAYVFGRNAGGPENWGQVARLSGTGCNFGDIVALSGDTAAVANDCGDRLDVFERNAGGADAWNRTASLTNGTPGFGRSLALDGDTLLVGALQSNTAFVLERNAGGPGNWGEVRQLTSGGAPAPFFGYRLALAGQVAIVTSFDGLATVFERNAGGAEQWGPVATLLPADHAAGDDFGVSVATDGQLAVLGSWHDDVGDNVDQGSATVFARDAGGAGAWGEIGKLLADDGAAGDGAWGVGLAGDTMILGAPYDDNAAGTNAGAAYVFACAAITPPAPTVRLVDSHGQGIAGAAITYYHAGWQPFGTTGADGRASLAIAGGTYPFRVAFAGATNQKSQDVGASPEVVFQTADVVVRLQDSAGAPLDTGAAEYYAAGWKTFGSTSGGAVHRELLPGSYPFAVTFGGARVQKTQDVGAAPEVVFATRDVTARLEDSTGAALDTGSVDYYAGGWRAFGTTSGGAVHRELLPASYPMAMTYAGARLQKTQDVGVDPLVVFQTRDVAVRLQTSAGLPLDVGSVEYYAGGWKPFGVTSGGEVRRELLPASYPIAMSYGGARVQLTQDVASAPVVTFQTRDVAVRLVDVAGLPLDGGVAEYYAGGWKPFGTAAGGAVHRELLGASYPFALSYGGARVQKTQDVTLDPTVTFQTGTVLSDSGTCTSYYAGGWRAFSSGMQLLPATYPFRFSVGTPSQQAFAVTAGTENHIR